MNGLAIGSIPSWGHIRTTLVPRHTVKPRLLVSSENLNGSSEIYKITKLLDIKLDLVCEKIYLSPLRIQLLHPIQDLRVDQNL
jgi:hypothetical protein